MINYGHKELIFPIPDYQNDEVDIEIAKEEFIHISVAKLVADELNNNIDFLRFENQLYWMIFEEFSSNLSENNIPNEQYFLNHENADIAQLTADLVSSPYELSENWQIRHKIDVVTEDKLVQEAVISAINNLKMKKVVALLDEKFNLLKDVHTEEERNSLLEELMQLITLKTAISEALGIVVVR